MKVISIYKNEIKIKMENRNLKKTPKNFQVYMQCSFSLNNLGVRLNLQSWSWCLRCCSVVVSSKGMHKVEQNYTLTHTHTHTKAPPSVPSSNAIQFH